MQLEPDHERVWVVCSIGEGINDSRWVGRRKAMQLENWARSRPPPYKHAASGTSQRRGIGKYTSTIKDSSVTHGSGATEATPDYTPYKHSQRQKRTGNSRHPVYIRYATSGPCNQDGKGRSSGSVDNEVQPLSPQALPPPRTPEY